MLSGSEEKVEDERCHIDSRRSEATRQESHQLCTCRKPMFARTTYHYDKLDPSLRQIRLFQVNASQQDRIHGSLRTFELDDAPSFQALSYAWGPRYRARISICIDGRALRVRRNLFDFLRCAQGACSHEHCNQDRSEAVLTHSMYIWIDQICIDQNSVKERNHQVQIMSRIYQRADRVIAWLGPGSSKTRDAFNELNYDTPDHTEMDETKSGLIQAFRSLDMLQYWSRLWIIQELLLAEDILLLCGRSQLRWDRLNTLESISRRSKVPRPKVPRPGHMIIKLVRQRQVQHVWRVDFSDLIHLFSSNACEDPRDKVYGLLGLLRAQVFLVPNYSKTVVEVFEDAVAYVAILHITHYRMKNSPRSSLSARKLYALGQEMGIIRKSKTAVEKKFLVQTTAYKRFTVYIDHVYDEIFELYTQGFRFQGDWQSQHKRIALPNLSR